MKKDRGVIYVAVGDTAHREQSLSEKTLKEWHDLPITVLDLKDYSNELKKNSRWAKLNIDELSPYKTVLYLDADTRVRGDLTSGFEIVESGFDLVVMPSSNQDGDLFWHVSEKEREFTFREVGYLPLQIQCGVWFTNINLRTKRFFQAWRAAYREFEDEDQAAFIRAFHRVPIKIWLLGFPWNGGALINHLFGRTRKGD